MTVLEMIRAPMAITGIALHPVLGVPEEAVSGDMV
jgi:hypothetical protein